MEKKNVDEIFELKSSYAKEESNENTEKYISTKFHLRCTQIEVTAESQKNQTNNTYLLYIRCITQYKSV